MAMGFGGFTKSILGGIKSAPGRFQNGLNEIQSSYSNYAKNVYGASSFSPLRAGGRVGMDLARAGWANPYGRSAMIGGALGGAIGYGDPNSSVIGGTLKGATAGGLGRVGWRYGAPLAQKARMRFAPRSGDQMGLF